MAGDNNLSGPDLADEGLPLEALDTEPRRLLHRTALLLEAALRRADQRHRPPR